MKPDLIMRKIAEAVKAREELASVVCRYSDSMETSPNPVCSFTLCLGADKSGFVRNSLDSLDYTCSIKLCLLAPSRAGGKRLSEMAQWVGEAVKDCVKADLIEISGAKFSEDSNSLYTDILVKIKEAQATENSEAIKINGKVIQGFLSAQAQSIEETEKKGQLLNGYTEVRKEGYVLSITTEYPMETADIFEVRLDFGEFGEVYEGAEITKSVHKITADGSHSFTYEIKAKSMKTEVAYEQ